MTYNGYTDFSDFFVINHIDLPFGSFKTSTQSNDTLDGTSFFKVSRGSYNLKIEATMISDESNNYRTIEQMRQEVLKRLQTKDIKPLTFSTMSDRYFNAIPSGEGMLSIVNPEVGKIELTFLIPEGLAHMINNRKQPFITDSDGVLVAKLLNRGTEWADVDFTITHNHENGYIGIVSEYGVIQLGKVDEADIETAYKQVILSRNTTNYSSWTKPTTWYENPQKDISGTLNVTSDFGTWLGPLSNLNPSTTKGYYGAARELVFDTPVTNLYMWARLWFETGIMGQTGVITLAFVAEDNTVLATMDIIKNDKVGNSANVIFGTPAGHIKTIPFTPSYWAKDNPYGSEGRLKNQNMFDMKIENGNARFFWYGGYYTFPIPAAHKDKKIKRIQYFEGQFKGRNSGKQLVTRMGIRDIIVADMKNAYQKDIVNRFEEGSVVFVDGVDKKAYYNGMLRLDDEIKGSKYFKIPPGETEVHIAYSDFSDPPPTVEAEIHEVFL